MAVGNVLFDDLGLAVVLAMKSVDYFDDVVGGNLADGNLAIFYSPKQRDNSRGALGQCKVEPDDYERETDLLDSKFGVFTHLIVFDFNDVEARNTFSVQALQGLQRLFDDNGLALLNTYFTDNGVVDANGNRNRLGKGGTVVLDPDPLLPVEDKKNSTPSIAYRINIGVWHRQDLR